MPQEKDLIRREVMPVVDKVLEMGDGDVARGTVRAFEAGVLDIPWSPNRFVKSRVLPTRDADGYLRIFDAAAMPIPKMCSTSTTSACADAPVCPSITSSPSPASTKSPSHWRDSPRFPGMTTENGPPHPRFSLLICRSQATKMLPA